MAKTKENKKAIGYVRVSRVKGREGDSFTSPRDQRRAIESLAAREGWDLIDVVEELDASGGDNARPVWNAVIDRIVSGEIAVMLVYDITRFSRNLVGAIDAIERIEAAGGCVRSNANDIGDNTATGRAIRNTLLSFGQMQREQAGERLASIQACAFENDIAMMSNIPYGYIRNAERKLEIDEPRAEHIRQQFRNRAAGWSWVRLTRWWAEVTGEETGKTPIRYRIQNRTYLGEAKYGTSLFKKNAHPAIVTRKLFDDANAVKGRVAERKGQLADQTLFAGMQLIHCHNCGGKMTVAGGPGYGCRNPHCEAKAKIKAKILDDEVLLRLRDYWRTFEFAGVSVHRTDGNGVQVEADIIEAREALESAQYDHRLLAKDKEARRTMGMDLWNEELAELAAAVDEARIALELAESEQAKEETKSNVADLWDEWSAEDQRAYLARAIDAIIVTPASGKRGTSAERRVALRLSDGLYLGRKASWSSEPFAEAQSFLKITSRGMARKAARA